MKKKFLKLSGWSFLLALGIFTLSFFIYHYITPDGTISRVFLREAGKPLITQLLAILGVMFLFTAMVSRLIARIFFPAAEEASEV